MPWRGPPPLPLASWEVPVPSTHLLPDPVRVPALCTELPVLSSAWGDRPGGTRRLLLGMQGLQLPTASHYV